MATTILPKIGRVNKRVSLKKLLRNVHENFECAYGDYDKAGDMEDHAYYAGLIDAYYNVEHLITDKHSVAARLFTKTDLALMAFGVYCFYEFQQAMNKLGDKARAEADSEGVYRVTDKE